MEELMDLWRKTILVMGVSLVIFGSILLTRTVITAEDMGEWTPNLTLLAIREGGVAFLGLLFIGLFVGEKISSCLADR